VDGDVHDLQQEEDARREKALSALVEQISETIQE
jgi:very-short-patch-repair endonuclease